MPAAIGFDDQSRFDAGEVDDIRGNRKLAAETGTKLMLAELSP